jgi:hypothetical protein
VPARDIPFLDVIRDLLAHVDALEEEIMRRDTPQVPRVSVLGGGVSDLGPPYTHATITTPVTPLTPCIGQPMEERK